MLSKEELSSFHCQMKDKVGRYRTQSLFWESRAETKNYIDDTLEPIFTIKDYDLVKDDQVFYSLKQIYLSYDHIPEFEYEFALDVFNSWDHWCRLANESIFKKEIKGWREELEIRIKADALRSMMMAAKSNDARGVAAAKYLADKGYAPRRGRPSKEEVERERKISAGISKDLESDMERLGLSVVSGGK